MQVAQGLGSALRFYDLTNPIGAVGFFANRNHFAALLNVTLVLAAFWLLQSESLLEGRALRTASIFGLAAAAVLFVATLRV